MFLFCTENIFTNIIFYSYNIVYLKFQMFKRFINDNVIYNMIIEYDNIICYINNKILIIFLMV